MNLGKEPAWKKGLLGGLVLVGGYFFYSNVISDSSDGPPRQPGAVASKVQAINTALNPGPAARGPVVRASASRTKSSEDFHPTMKLKPDEVLDPMAIDPTLRLDLLAKVQGLDLPAAGRNLFQFGQPPPPPIPPAPVVVPKTKEQIEADKKKAEQPKNPGPAPNPGPLPLNLTWKYFGFASGRGNLQKKAFFLDGEDILTASEGEVLKKKYRVVRIGVNSVVLEDTETKSQQTMPLLEEAVA